MRKSTILITLGMCLILCLPLLPIAAYVITYLLPREYTSIAALEVKSDQSPINTPGGVENPPGSIDPHFVADQVQIFESKALLLPVIDQLNLVDKWSAGLPAKLSKDAVYEKLFKMIKVEEKRDTDMLLIEATSTDRQEAADIANTLAVTYQKRRRDDLEQQITNALSELNAEVEKQRQKVKEAQDEVAKIRLRNNILDPNPDTMDGNAKPSDAEYQAAKQNYINAKKLLDAAEQKYESESMELHIELTPAKIWDRAEPAREPSSPNVVVFLLLATALGFLCALCGAVLLFIGLRVRRRETLPPI